MKLLKIGLFALVLLSFVLCINAADVQFSGYTYNTTENALNSTNITIEIYDSFMNLDSTFSNMSNASGYWSINITDTTLNNNLVKFIPRHFTEGRLDKIGANLPAFPYSVISSVLNLTTINFYLREGATINITAVNESNDEINFTYMLKDTKLGYDIESDWTSQVTQKSIYVPADRNYSVEIFPNMQLPVYYELNNLSDYASPKKVNKVFNATTKSVRVSGRVNLSNGTGTFEEVSIVNYLMEPGDMVFAGQPMPYNLSAWFSGGEDSYNATTGTYNLTVPATAESSKTLMFAIGKSGGRYYGAFRNITLVIGGGAVNNFNFTLYQLLGNGTNIPVSTAGGGSMNIGANQTNFQFVNSSGDALTTTSGHIEVELEYSKLDASMPDFTWMEDVSETGGGKFSLPLLNYAVKKMNIFSQTYAPKKLTYTAAQINNTPVNISLTSFNPGGIGGNDISGIQMRMIRSSATCDVPMFPSSCDLSGAGMGGQQSEDDFKPLNAVISGAKISMIIAKDNVMVHYINVDMLASGPPDAAFDESASSSSSGASAIEDWRFGSLGPEIYDSLIVSFPYTSSTVDESQDINVSIPKLYDNDWNTVWDTSTNGTDGIATNLTDYADYNTSWFSGINCSKTDKSANCFVNTSLDRIWIRIPHFSGTGPSTTGTSTSSGTSSPSSGGSSSSKQQCRDSIDNDGDGLIDYPNDPGCASRYDNSEGDSTTTKTSCKENWICVSWSECKQGKQTRTCMDYKKCGTEDEKPALERKCTEDSQPPERSGSSVGEIRRNDGATWKWDGNVWVKQGSPGYDQIGLEAEKEEIPSQAVIPLKKRTYNWIFAVLGAVLIALIALALIIKRKQ